MESEDGRDSGDAGRDVPLVFISDASAEAERLARALGARGYTVADVPLALLPSRVTVQRPSVVVCDADADGALEALQKVREASGELPIPVILLGDRNGAMEQLDQALVVAAFARPVNAAELIGTVDRLVGAPRIEATSSVRGGKVATSSRPPARSGSPSVLPQRERSVRPEGLSSAAAIPLPPDLAGDPAPREAADAPVVELSVELQNVLVSAEKRLAENRAPVSAAADELGPEAAAEGPLPPDVLSALDEPLDEEDIGDEGSSADQVRDGTAALTGSKLGGFGHTRAGRTGSMVLGEGGTETPESEPSPSARGVARAGTAIQGPALEMPKAPSAPPASAPSEEDTADQEDKRRARQQASTPKPPRPALEEAKVDPGAVPVSLAPATTAEPPIAPESLRSEGAAPPATGTGSGVERHELSSTTPPLHRRDEVTGDERTPAERRSEHPGPSQGTRVERPAEQPSFAAGNERPSDVPSSGFGGPPAPPRGDDEARVPVAPRTTTPEFSVPAVLRPGDTIAVIAMAIRSRFTGALALEVDEGIRRIVFREGDFVTVASGVHGESLVAFLASRGDLPADVARQAHKLPAFGRRAGAALIAMGHLAQDQLWTVLRAHAEWLVGRACRITRGQAGLEDQLVDRLKDEPAVFGGATGAEVLVDVVRRVVPPEEAVDRLGGAGAVFAKGPSEALLSECALRQDETERVVRAPGSSVSELVETAPDPSFASALFALLALGVLGAEGARPRAEAKEKKKVERDAIDDEALRARILARKALVDEGDYFALLGVTRDATGYDIRRAYSSLRKEFEPNRLLTSATADLGDVVGEIVDVLEEAYEVLGDQQRRDRYRRAIEAVP